MAEYIAPKPPTIASSTSDDATETDNVEDDDSNALTSAECAHSLSLKAQSLCVVVRLDGDSDRVVSGEPYPVRLFVKDAQGNNLEYKMLRKVSAAESSSAVEQLRLKVWLIVHGAMKHVQSLLVVSDAGECCVLLQPLNLSLIHI